MVIIKDTRNPHFRISSHYGTVTSGPEELYQSHIMAGPSWDKINPKEGLVVIATIELSDARALFILGLTLTHTRAHRYNQDCLLCQL